MRTGCRRYRHGRRTEVVTEETRVLNNIDLKGMRIAVTGGTSGLGLALVRNLAASRARVAFVARRAQLVERDRKSVV